MESFEGPQEELHNKEEKAREELDRMMADREKVAQEKAAKTRGEALSEAGAEEDTEENPSSEEERKVIEELDELGVKLNQEDSERDSDSLFS